MKLSSKQWPVLLTAAVVLLLAGTLAARLVGSSKYGGLSSRAPSASVPAPVSAPIDQLVVPCWSCPESEEWPVRFQTDLDLLAPLGDGDANAAVFFKDFTKPDGPRYQEAAAAMKARVDGPDWLGKVLPADHSLLVEAAPWCDQATMRFYPDVFVLEGLDTRIPNLLVMLNFAKSWVARGVNAEDTAAALEDSRRAIRLGRLLRQDDTTIIADLVGLACIRVGAEGIYRIAMERGHLELGLIAAVVLGEHAPQRLLTSERVTTVMHAADVRVDDRGDVEFRIDDNDLDRVIEMATTSPERRFTGEAFILLGVVRHFGTPAQQQRVLDVLGDSNVSPDPVVQSLARWAMESPRDEAMLKEYR
jgi:hypothetical protein